MTFESFLRQPFLNDELVKIAQLENEIHAEQARVMALPDDCVAMGIQQMATLRLKASGTLQRGECTGWMRANTFIQNQIQEQVRPSWISVTKLNSFLTNHDGSIRQQEIYTGYLQACPHDELETTLAYYQKYILPASDVYSALTHAALCQYWLVSIHPFLDGNGRTSILLTDWLLALNGYLPQSFSSKVDAIVMYVPARPKKMTPGMSVAKILENVLRSYRCFSANSH